MSKKVTARLVPILLVIALVLTFGLVMAYAPTASVAKADDDTLFCYADDCFVEVKFPNNALYHWNSGVVNISRDDWDNNGWTCGQWTFTYYENADKTQENTFLQGIIYYYYSDLCQDWGTPLADAPTASGAYMYVIYYGDASGDVGNTFFPVAKIPFTIGTAVELHDMTIEGGAYTYSTLVRAVTGEAFDTLNLIDHRIASLASGYNGTFTSALYAYDDKASNNRGALICSFDGSSDDGTDEIVPCGTYVAEVTWTEDNDRVPPLAGGSAHFEIEITACEVNDVEIYLGASALGTPLVTYHAEESEVTTPLCYDPRGFEFYLTSTTKGDIGLSVAKWVKTDYYLTTDETFDEDKTYYTLNGTVYEAAPFVPVGALIPSDTYYEAVVTESADLATDLVTGELLVNAIGDWYAVIALPNDGYTTDVCCKVTVDRRKLSVTGDASAAYTGSPVTPNYTFALVNKNGESDDLVTVLTKSTLFAGDPTKSNLGTAAGNENGNGAYRYGVQLKDAVNYVIGAGATAYDWTYTIEKVSVGVTIALKEGVHFYYRQAPGSFDDAFTVTLTHPGDDAAYVIEESSWRVHTPYGEFADFGALADRRNGASDSLYSVSVKVSQFLQITDDRLYNYDDGIIYYKRQGDAYALAAFGASDNGTPLNGYYVKWESEGYRNDDANEGTLAIVLEKAPVYVRISESAEKLYYDGTSQKPDEGDYEYYLYAVEDQNALWDNVFDDYEYVFIETEDSEGESVDIDTWEYYTYAFDPKTLAVTYTLMDPQPTTGGKLGAYPSNYFKKLKDPFIEIPSEEDADPYAYVYYSTVKSRLDPQPAKGEKVSEGFKTEIIPLVKNAYTTTEAKKNAGTYALSGVINDDALYGFDGNYALVIDEGATFTIAKKIRASMEVSYENTNSTYGDAVDYFDHATFTSGLVTGDEDVEPTSERWFFGAKGVTPSVYDMGDAEWGTYWTEWTGTEFDRYSDAGWYYIYYVAEYADYETVTAVKTHTIGKATLTVKAKDKEITYGDDAPQYDYEISGYVEGSEDTDAVLSGSVTATCTTYSTWSGQGTYEITLVDNTLTADNYTITTQPGTLTVKKKALSGFAIAQKAGEEGKVVYDRTEKSAVNTNYILFTYGTLREEDNAALTITYKKEGDAEYTDTAPAWTAAGSYTVYYKVTSANYEGADGSYTFTISPRPITVNFNATLDANGESDVVKTYNNTALRPTYTSLDGVADDEAITLSFTSEWTDANEYHETFTLVAGENTALANYALVAVGEVTTNVYNGAYWVSGPVAGVYTGHVNFKVAPIALTVSWEGNGDLKTYGELRRFELVYNGTAQRPAAALVGVLAADAEKVAFEWNDNYAAHTDVWDGSQLAVIKSALVGDKAGNYVFKTGEEGAVLQNYFTIVPKPITVNWGATSFPYNGTDQRPTVSISDGMICDGDASTVTCPAYGATAGETVDANTLQNPTYTATVTLGGEKAGNYTITNASVDYTIDPAALSLTIQDKEVVYGEPLLSFDVEVVGTYYDTLSDIYTVVCMNGDSPIDEIADVGVYDITLAMGSRASNYNVTVTNASGKATCTIIRRVITVTWSLVGVSGKLVAYDGEEHEVTAVFNNTVGDGLDANEFISGEKKARNVKPENKAYQCSIPAGNVGNNYVIEEESVFKWKISRKSVTIVYNGGVKNVVYGDADAWESLGEEMDENGYYVTIQEPSVLGKGDAITDVVNVWIEDENGTPVDLDEKSPVGTYFLKASSKSNPNYSIQTIALGDDAKLVIAPATIIVQEVKQDLGDKEDNYLVYNGEAQVAEVDLSGIATVGGQEPTIIYQYLADEEEELDPNNWSEDVPAFTLMGEYKVYYLISAENHEPYGGNKDTYFIVEIVGAPLEEVSIGQSGELVYNGGEQQAKLVRVANSLLPEINPVTWYYRLDEEEEWSEEEPSFVVANLYTVYYKASAPNHLDTIGSFEIEIIRADLTDVSVTQTGVSVYDGTEQTATVNCEATVMGDEAVSFVYGLDGENYSEELPKFIDAGEYEVFFIASAENHNSYAGSFVITIEKADLKEVYADQDFGEFDEETDTFAFGMIYDGTPQTAHVTTYAESENDQTITFTFSANADGTYTATIPAFVDAGYHTVYYKANAANHNEATGEFDVFINEKALEVEFTVANTVYGTPLIAPTFDNRGIVINGWVEGEETMLTALDEEGLAEYLSIYYFPKGDYKTYAEFEEATFADMAEEEAEAYAEAHKALPTAAGNYFVLLMIMGVENYEGYADVVEITIAKKALVVTYEGGGTDYGVEADAFENGVIYEGFVKGETEQVLGGALDFDTAYTPASDTGEYGVTPKGLTSDNYEITFVGGVLYVGKAGLDLDAFVDNVTYGTAVKVPVLGDGLIVENWTNGDTAELLEAEGVLTVGFAPAKYDGEFLANIEDLEVMEGVPTQVGEYIFFVIIDGLKNYGSAMMECTFEIEPKKITVTADDKWSYYKEDLAELTWSGAIEAGDTVCTASTNANKDVVGEYTITLTSVNNPNYVVILRDGKYLVKEAKTEIKTDGGEKKAESYKDIRPEDAKRAEGVTITDAIKSIYRAATEANAPVVKLELKIGAAATVAFDKAAIAKLAEANDVKLSYVEYKKEEIDTAVAKYAKAEFVIEVSLGDKTFEGGTATISTAFENKAPSGKKAVLYYVDEAGKKVDMNATFEDGILTFETGHFSTYVVEYVMANSSVAGIVVGGVVGAAGIAVAVLLLLKRKKGGKKEAVTAKEETPAADEKQDR